MAHALVFDSGVGGLSVVAELRALMPDLHITYAADDEFRPYGNKTEAQLQARLPGLLKTLVLAANPDALVIACNTASTTALAQIRDAVNIPVVGVVPAIKPAAQASQSKTIAVLGTPGTVRRKYVDKLIADFAGDCQVVLHGSTGLVELAERKLTGQDINIEDIRSEIMSMFTGIGGENIDTVVLACTHFPLLLDELESAALHTVSWIDSGAAIARRVQSILQGATINPRPDEPQSALLVGGVINAGRAETFASFGFKKTVIL